MTHIDVMRSIARASALIGASTSPAEAGSHAVETAKALGFHSLSILANERGAPKVVYTNAPEESVQEYHSNNYVADDPLVALGSNAIETHSAEELASRPMTPQQRKVFKFVYEKTDCDAALIIPVVRSVHESGVIVFGGKQADMSPMSRAALTVLGHCVYGRLQELKARPVARCKTTLSAREREVLGWVAKGKCDSEIAIILGMSERTARFHVANAKAKLDTPSRVQAVTKALELGLLAA
jgi:DNA-binding CsgD family transcriptional regulator